MRNTEYYENERLKSKGIVSNISNSLKQMQWKISDLDRSKKKTDNIIQKFDIDCYKYNLVDEWSISKERLEKNIKAMLEKLNTINAMEFSESSVKKINYINDILSNSEIQLKGIDKEQINDIENLQLNAIKKGIYNKFMLIKSDIDRDKIKTKFDKLQNRSAVMRWLDNFLDIEDDVDRKKENLFMQIQEIDKVREDILKNTEPTKEYKIVEILADIELFLMDNKSSGKYKEEMSKIRQIRTNINNTFSIDYGNLRKTIVEKRQSRLPVKINRKLNKLIKERQKAIAFLNKNGYIKGDYKEEPIIESRLVGIIRKLDIISEGIEKILKV